MVTAKHQDQYCFKILNTVFYMADNSKITYLQINYFLHIYLNISQITTIA
jgi:hypothetical protein